MTDPNHNPNSTPGKASVRASLLGTVGTYIPDSRSMRSVPSVLISLLSASLLLSAFALSLPLLTPLPPVENPSAFLAEIPAPSPNALESWLISAAAVLSLFALGKQLMRKTPIEAEFLTKKEFNEFRDKVDTSFNSLRDRIDNSHQTLSTKLDTLNDRIADVRSSVDRVDERTRKTRNP